MLKSLHQIVRVEDFSIRGSRHIERQEENHDSFAWGKNEEGVWAVVGDGCSSSLNAKQGSIDLVAIAEGIFKKSPKPFEDVRELEALLLAELAQKRYVYPGNFCSTLVAMQVSGNKVDVYFFGDGSFLYQNCDGAWHEWAVNYSQSAPRFLHYFVEGIYTGYDRDSAVWTVGVGVPQQETLTHSSWGEYGWSTSNTPGDQCSPTHLTFDLNDIDPWSIAICSDGVTDTRGNLFERMRLSGYIESMADFAAQLETNPPQGYVPPADDATMVCLRVRQG